MTHADITDFHDMEIHSLEVHVSLQLAPILSFPSDTVITVYND
jgi:hypothetical protein